ncbi:MAG TPA: hypothetical protein VM935_04200, partial [Chitinophagaceae bacterium]|nr:hypothetical protein [Chitinophagaceae bacterium]
EAHHLRLAFEEVTGKDLNWFWNQWYFGAGHPKLDVNYSYDAGKKQVQVITRQTQADSNIFQLPLALDIVLNSGRTRHNIVLQNRVDTFVFSSTTKPSFINVDADKTLLAEKTENKTMDEYLAQYKAGRTYLDRKEAIDAAALKQEEQRAVEILMLGLKDKYHGLQTYTLEKLDLDKKDLKTLAEESIAKLARESSIRSVKAAAIKRLEEYGFAKYIPLFQNALTDSSYTVAGNALEALRKVDSTIAYSEAKKLVSTNPKGTLAKAIGSVMMLFNDESASDLILNSYKSLPFGQQKLDDFGSVVQLLVNTRSDETFKKGVDIIIELRDQIPGNYKDQIVPYVEGTLKQLQKAKTAAAKTEQSRYIESRLSEKKSSF